MQLLYKKRLEAVRDKFNKDHSLKWFGEQRDSGLNAFEDLAAKKYIKGNIILDMGCASGRTTRVLAQRYEMVVGMDVALNLLHLGKERQEDLRLVCGDIMSPPFRREAFDSIYMMGNIIQYIPLKRNRIKVYAEICRILKPGGTFVMTTTNFAPTIRFDLYHLYKNMTSCERAKPKVMTQPGGRRFIKHLFRSLYFRDVARLAGLWKKWIRDLIPSGESDHEAGDFRWKSSPYLKRPDSYFFFYNSLDEVLKEALSADLEFKEYKCRTEMEKGYSVPENLRFCDSVKIYVFKKRSAKDKGLSVAR